ncbi:MAG: hypothetical protein J6P28_03850 [Treponema sp.]|nr:hypothetical protein [Treponema sp.]MBR6144931.1 hypothetical protein [Treponema sp.]
MSEEEEYIPKTWEILAGVVCAETYEEFDRAYSLLKRGKKAPKKSSVDLWKVVSGEYKELNEGRRKKWEEKKKLEKLQQQEKKNELNFTPVLQAGKDERKEDTWARSPIVFPCVKRTFC